MGPGWIVLFAFVGGWIGFAVLASKRGWSRTVGYAGGGFVGAIVAFCAFVALGSAGYIEVPEKQSGESATETARPTAEQPSARFDRATATQLEEIRFFLSDGFSIDHAYSAPSQVTRGGYFVAAEITHPDADPGAYFGGGDVALWYHSGEPDDVGQVLAVDALADEACTCFYARDTDAEILPSDASDLTSYVRSQIQE